MFKKGFDTGWIVPPASSTKGCRRSRQRPRQESARRKLQKARGHQRMLLLAVPWEIGSPNEIAAPNMLGQTPNMKMPSLAAGTANNSLCNRDDERPKLRPPVAAASYVMLLSVTGPAPASVGTTLPDVSWTTIRPRPLAGGWSNGRGVLRCSVDARHST